MQIESRLSGYGYPAKPYILDRKVEENAPAATEIRRFSDGAITGSSTLLSSSLANALWAVEGDRHDVSDMPSSSSIAQVEDIYSEF
jgi:hypothetical protein